MSRLAIKCAAEMVRNDERHPGMCELITILDALGVTDVLGIDGMANLVVALQMNREKKGLHLVMPSPLEYATAQVREMYDYAKAAGEPEIIRIRKGRAVGKSTEVGAEQLRKKETLQERVIREKNERLTFNLGDKLKERLKT